MAFSFCVYQSKTEAVVEMYPGSLFGCIPPTAFCNLRTAHQYVFPSIEKLLSPKII